MRHLAKGLLRLGRFLEVWCVIGAQNSLLAMIRYWFMFKIPQRRNLFSLLYVRLVLFFFLDRYSHSPLIGNLAEC